MTMKIEDVLKLARANIAALTPYQSARSIHSGKGIEIFLDANENPREPYANSGSVNRYPDQQPEEMMEKLCSLYGVTNKQIIATRGADEAIDLLVRSFCDAGRDNIIVSSPTFPMYGIAARVQGADVIDVPLKDDFQMDVEKILQAETDDTKIIFVCSPNNPTSNLMNEADIIRLCEESTSLIVLDETYIEFSDKESFVSVLDNYPNLVILRTLSKTYALAGARCGVAIAHPDIIALLLKVLPVYPVPQPVVQAVCTALQPANLEKLNRFVGLLRQQRDYLTKMLQKSDDIVHVYPSDANFFLVKVKNAKKFTDKCLDAGVLVRSQDSVMKDHIRFSIGDVHENKRLLSVLGVDASDIRDGNESGRIAFLSRTTKETDIHGFVDLDEPGCIQIDTGIGFYDHMLEQVASHGNFSLILTCRGDLNVDEHHTMEDSAILLGQLIRRALGNKAGIGRFGFTAPMDESLARIGLDISGRGFLKFEGDFPREDVGGMPTEMVEHVIRSFAESLGVTIHMEVTGENAHHMVEACFKGLGRSLRAALHKQGDEMPSTKGVL